MMRQPNNKLQLTQDNINKFNQLLCNLLYTSQQQSSYTQISKLLIASPHSDILKQFLEQFTMIQTAMSKQNTTKGMINLQLQSKGKPLQQLFNKFSKIQIPSTLQSHPIVPKTLQKQNNIISSSTAIQKQSFPSSSTLYQPLFITKVYLQLIPSCKQLITKQQMLFELKKGIQLQKIQKFKRSSEQNVDININMKKQNQMDKFCIMIYIVYFNKKLYGIQKDIVQKNCQKITKEFIEKNGKEIKFEKYKEIYIQNQYASDKQSFRFYHKRFKEKVIQFNKQHFQLCFTQYFEQKLIDYAYESDNNKKQQIQKDFNKLYDFIYKLLSKIYDVVNYWHQQQSFYRICVIPTLLQSRFSVRQPNYYFYHQFKQARYDQKQRSYSVSLIQILPLKQFILTHQNQSFNIQKYDNLRFLKQSILQILSISNNSQLLTDMIQSNLKSSKKHQQKQLSIQSRVNRLKSSKQKLFKFKQYQNNILQSFFNRWLNKYQQNEKYIKEYYCVSIGDMYLIEEYKYINMKCVVKMGKYDGKDNKIKQEKQQVRRYKYDFDQNTDDWNVLLRLRENQPKFMLFQLPKSSKYNNNNNNISFTFNLTADQINKNQKRPVSISSYLSPLSTTSLQPIIDIGQKHQLQLFNQQNQTIGFMDIFYIKKRYFDHEQLQRSDPEVIRNINILKNIGKLPANYYQTTKIKYKPQMLRFYMQILNVNNNNNNNNNNYYNKQQQISISKYNFQKTYLKLVQFLQSERKYKQRTRIIQTQKKLINQQVRGIFNHVESDVFGKRLHFHPMERKSQYEKIINGSNNNNNLSQQHKRYSSRFINKNINEINFNISIINFVKTCISTLCSEAHYETFIISSMLIQRSSLQHQCTLSINPYMIPLINRIITIYKLGIYNDNNNDSDRLSINSNKNIYSSQSKQIQINIIQCFQFVSNILTYFYPFSLSSLQLQRDLLFIRNFIHRYLCEFNFLLNRKHIGLQNLSCLYLLSLFSYKLQQQLTFQIWDFIILSPNKSSARLTVLLTLMIFLEKTNLQPIIPINIFVQALYKNYDKFDIGGKRKKVSDKLLEKIGIIYQKQHIRKKLLYNIKSNKTGKFLLDHQWIKKILFDDQRKYRIHVVGSNKVSLADLRYKLPQPKYYGYQVEQINIFLRGFSIFDTFSISSKFYLIIRHGNIQSQKIRINQKIQILNQYIKFPIIHNDNIKNYLFPIEFIFYNQSYDNNNNDNNIPDKLFVGMLQIDNLHKNVVYNEEVRLIFVKNQKFVLNNKGENVFNVMIVLKAGGNTHNNTGSNNINNNRNDIRSPQNNQNNKSRQLNLQKQYYQSQILRKQKLYSTIFDYQLNSQLNQPIKHIQQQLCILFTKMKQPIDQFRVQSSHHNNNINIINNNNNNNIAALYIPFLPRFTFPQAITNSSLLIQHFQQLIYQLFPFSSQLHICIPQLYKLFSCELNYQFLYLTQLLIESILINKQISYDNKIDYLYLICRHYQNTSGKGISGKTMDWLIEYVYKIYGWSNAVGYSTRNIGKIKKAIVYIGEIKKQQKYIDITNILQDWHYVNKVKYATNGVVLGTATKLTVLQSLLDVKTLEKLSKQASVCRLEIVYSKVISSNSNINQQQQQQNSKLYTSCYTFNPIDFSIIKIGSKFLQKYPLTKQFHSGSTIHHNLNSCKCKQKLIKKCSNINNNFHNTSCKSNKIQLDITSQILFNCSSYINLQSRESITREEFRREIMRQPMLGYLLGYSSMYEVGVVGGKEEKKDYVENYKKDFLYKQKQVKTNAWSLYRYHHCLQKYLPCRLISYSSQSRSLSTVTFPFSSSVSSQQNKIRSLLQQKYKLKLLSQQKQKLCYQIPIFEIWSMEQSLVKKQENRQENYNDNQKKRRMEEKMKVIRKKSNRLGGVV